MDLFSTVVTRLRPNKLTDRHVRHLDGQHLSRSWISSVDKNVRPGHPGSQVQKLGFGGIFGSCDTIASEPIDRHVSNTIN